MRIVRIKKLAFMIAMMVFIMAVLPDNIGLHRPEVSQAAPLAEATSCFPTADLVVQRLQNSSLGDNFYGDHDIDFDGDGKADVFTVDNQGNYKFSSGARDPWQVLRQDSVAIENLRFGDFDGDGITDLFKKTGNQWAYSSRGIGNWQNLGQSNVDLENLRFGQFDNDPRTDIFYRAANGDWLYSSGGTTVWTPTGQNSGFSVDNFRFVDLDGNGKTDIFRVDGLGQFIVSYDAATPWQNLLYVNNASITDVRFGQFDNDAGADVFMEVIPGKWSYSSGGSSPFVLIKSATVLFDQLRLSDFDGNGRSDLFNIAANNRWQISKDVIGEPEFLMPTIDTDSGLLKCIGSDDDVSSYSSLPAISADGTKIAFESSADILGNGSQNDVNIWLLDLVTNQFTKVTPANLNGGSSHDPHFSNDGQKLVFESDVDFLNQGNVFGFEIWLYDIQNAILERITNGSVLGSNSYDGRTDASGQKVVFLSNHDFIVGGIPNVKDELWLYDRQSQTYRQLTETSLLDGQIFSPVISSDGTRVIFSSDVDFLNQGLGLYEYEIWQYNLVDDSLTRLTNGAGRQSFDPEMSSDGNKIVFAGNADFLGTGIPATQYEVWLLDLNTGDFQQITNGVPLGHSLTPNISGDGKTIAFSSNVDFNGEGISQDDDVVWQYHVPSGQLSRLSEIGAGTSGNPSLSFDGLSVTFTSNVDFTGQGTPEYKFEVWLLDTNIVTTPGGYKIYLPFTTK